MHEEVVQLSEITFIGITCETNNQLEAQDSQIVQLYDRFINENLSSQIDHKIGAGLIALYTHYENGESGQYTYGIGHQVKDPEDMPDGCDIIDIPAGKYLKFTTERGPLNIVTANAWQKIWHRSQTGTLSASRAYQTDFEFHHYEDDHLHDVIVDIYISIL